MKLTYSKSFPNINKATPHERVEAFKKIVLKLLEDGKDVKEINETIELFIKDEQYEVVEGIKLAIKDYYNLKNINLQ